MAASARTATRQRTPFLPPQVHAGLKRFGRRLWGAVIFLAGVLLATALIGYAPTDPSLNTSATGTVLNPLGLPGALVADMAVQTLGLAAIAPVLGLIGWGGRLVLGRAVGWVWLRLLSLIAAALLVAMGLTALPHPETWALPSGLGGFSGTLLVAHAQRALTLSGVTQDLRWMIAGSAGLLGLGLLFWSIAVRLTEWKAVGSGIGAGARLASDGAGRVAGAAARLPRVSLPGHRSQDDGRAVSPAAPTLRSRAVQTDGATDQRREPVMGDRAAGQPAQPPVPQPQPSAPLPRTAAIVTTPPPRAPSKRELESRQGSLLPEDDADGFRLPPLDHLGLPTGNSTAHLDEDALSQNARLLEGVLSDFGVNGTIVKVRPGPVVTLYELEPAPGTKTSRVVGLADDIARSMSAVSVRIAVVPGKSTIGIELPNARREMVNFRELLSADEFHKTQGGLSLALGRDIGGAPVYVDLTRMPHLLIAGTTGSGKSVGINTMICSLLYRMKPEECRFIMIDPKMLELSVYDGIPHLLTPVVTDPAKAVVALKWAVKEMENRYRAMSQMGVRNISGYNQRLRDAVLKGQQLTRTVQTGFDPETGKPIYEEQDLEMAPLPFIVVIVDEMADLMLVAGKDVEAAIQRLAQMARAAGIHLVMATQRPSVDVITGTIKANFPTRISFQVTSKIDSRTILGEQGAEQLLGAGDMLYMAAGGRVTRVHGPFVSDTEVEAVVSHLRDQAQPEYINSVTDEDEQGPSAILDAMTGGGSGGSEGTGDDLFDQAVALVARERKASTSFVQRYLQIGYNRAARIIERMEAEGMVGKPNHVGKREVLLPPPHEEY